MPFKIVAENILKYILSFLEKKGLTKGTESLDVFSAIFTKETTFVASCLLFCTPAPSEKGSTLKGKNLLPRGANSFLLE